MSEGIGEGSPTDPNTTGIITAKKLKRAIFFKSIFPHKIYHNQFDNLFGESQKIYHRSCYEDLFLDV